MTETADLSHAIIALAKASAEIGVVFREVIGRLDRETDERHETNRILARIHDQNGNILTRMEEFASAHRESEREIRVVQSTMKSHGEYLVAVGKKIGLPAPEFGAVRRASADR